MIKVTQTKYSVFNSKGERLTYGNCLVACLASILEMPIDEIPNIYTFYGLKDEIDGDPTPPWLDILNAWLRMKLGLKMVKVDPVIGSDSVKDFGDSVYDWAICRGLSVRGLPHCTIINLKHQAPSWDPHPSREGLKEIHYYWKLVKA